MKAKLVKTAKLYALKTDDIIATNDDYFSTKLEHPYRLSTKNCEAIVNGYDLDELAKTEYPIGEVWNDEEALIRELAFKKGFQKALELMKHRLVEETEWQVEVLMDICGDKVYAVPEPVLDEQGCLILKRIDN